MKKGVAWLAAVLCLSAAWLRADENADWENAQRVAGHYAVGQQWWIEVEAREGVWGWGNRKPDPLFAPSSTVGFYEYDFKTDAQRKAAEKLAEENPNIEPEEVAKRLGVTCRIVKPIEQGKKPVRLLDVYRIHVQVLSKQVVGEGKAQCLRIVLKADAPQFLHDETMLKRKKFVNESENDSGVRNGPCLVYVDIARDGRACSYIKFPQWNYPYLSRFYCMSGEMHPLLCLLPPCFGITKTGYACSMTHGGRGIRYDGDKETPFWECAGFAYVRTKTEASGRTEVEALPFSLSEDHKKSPPPIPGFLTDDKEKVLKAFNVKPSKEDGDFYRKEVQAWDSPTDLLWRSMERRNLDGDITMRCRRLDAPPAPIPAPAPAPASGTPPTPASAPEKASTGTAK